jgi:peptide/nickel transport system permease protein
LRFDFGTSWRDERPVVDIIGEGLGPSLSLTVPAFLLETIIAISLALFCAFYRATLIDRLTVIGAVALMSIPGLAYILFAQKVIAYDWRLFPFFGYEPLPAGFVFFALPILIWLALAIGSEVRFYRAVMLEEMSQDYVRTAAAKGLPARGILFRHVLKNSMIQVITRVVISIPFLILGSLLLEYFFGIPGLGNRTVEAVNRSDFPVVQAFVVIGSILYIVFSIVTDLCYAWVDPRVRLR